LIKRQGSLGDLQRPGFALRERLTKKHLSPFGIFIDPNAVIVQSGQINHRRRIAEQ
jgi:hypothetical protein